MEDLFKQIDNFLSDLFIEKAPTLPEKTKKFIVSVLPWGAVFMTISTLPLIMAGFGLSMISLPLAIGFGVASGGFLVGILSVGVFILGAMSIKPLFDKQEKGWRLSFYGVLLGMVISVVSFQITNLLVEAVALYFLYQVKEFYTTEKTTVSEEL